MRRKLLGMAVIALSVAAISAPAEAGNVVSRKTGASATVSPRHAAAFQAYIDDLEAHGAAVRFMGGIRRGHCASGSQHPCGSALDVCQTRRGAVDPRCRLPGRHEIASIASAHGLFEGGRWCNSDYGHAQIGGDDCSSHSYSARRHGRQKHPHIPDYSAGREMGLSAQ